MNIFMNRLFCLFISFISVICITSCEKSEIKDTELYFIGSSTIAMWDLEVSFPNRITHNYGIPGYSIYDLRSTHIPDDGIAIILIGGNDLKYVQQKDSKFYKNYKEIINGIGGKKTFLLEVIPTENVNNNKYIVELNDSLKVIMKDVDSLEIIECYDKLSENGVVRKEYSRDGLHLNYYGYSVLSNLVNKRL